MDNKGYETEGRTTPDEEIHPSVSRTEDACLPVDTDSNCPCIESQTECSCGRVKPETSKIELQTWVKPKGLLLVGISVALIAWCTIYFTLSALQLL